MFQKPSGALLPQELFIQAGPVQSVYVPKDRVTNENNGFAFVEMKTERDAEYAAKVSARLRGAKAGGEPDPRSGLSSSEPPPRPRAHTRARR